VEEGGLGSADDRNRKKPIRRWPSSRVAGPRYEPNPKHKPVPTPGRRGSICPPDVKTQELLDGSQLVNGKRYATDGERAYCGQCHDRERDLWHGYPVGWEEVPPPVRIGWERSGLVSRRRTRGGRSTR